MCDGKQNDVFEICLCGCVLYVIINREGGREGGREGVREGGREGARERGRERGRREGKNKKYAKIVFCLHCENEY